ncbi:GtrA family protein [Aestuariicella sp. G3-2]|uniref:GtrA family protein n=1 Tax=Pseudomaricurvus albidus TaxID=2842452 RepID=UPI001C0AD420|nr:GtrA family protein [Aestuariicella albida]
MDWSNELKLQVLVRSEFFRFCLVGALNTTISYGVFSALVIYDVWYVLASSVGFFLATLNSFYVNKSWTFSSHKKQVPTLFISFVFINVIGFFLNLIILYSLHEFIRVNVYLAQLVSLVLVTFFNFTFTKMLFKS